MFTKLAACLADKPLFPSISHVNGIAIDLSPDGSRDESDMRSFVRTCVEKPAARIATKYLTETGATGTFAFKYNANSSSQDPNAAPSTASSNQSEGSDTSEMSDASGGVLSQAASEAEDSPAEMGRGTARRRTKRAKKTRPVFSVAEMGVPDRWGLLDLGPQAGAATLDGSESEDGRRYLVPKLVGEYKAAHKLPEDMMMRILGNDCGEDFFVRVAKTQGKSSGASKSDAAPATAEPDIGDGGVDSVQSDPGLVSDRGSTVSAVDAKEAKQVGSARVARVLCQAYHYMIMAGLEYGYVAAGKALVFLRVRHDDPATLYYFLSAVQPQTEVSDGDAHEQAKATVLARMCTQSLLGVGSQTRGPALVREVAARLGRWPKPYPKDSDSDLAAIVMSPEDEDDDDDEDNERSGRRRKQPKQDPKQTGLKPPSNASTQRGPSPLRHGMATSELSSDLVPSGPLIPCFDNTWGMSPAARRLRAKKLPYCTQACLLGLSRGTALDKSCPNVALHTAPVEDDHDKTATDLHPITAPQLCRLLARQLYDDLDLGCECLEEWGYYGAIGVLFRITLAGYGYTFVAKGVRHRARGALRRESRIYRHLEALQGRLVPVMLGRVSLVGSPYPLRSCGLVSHMMLMSWAGSRRVPKGIDGEVEALRTSRELRRAGLVNDDERSANMAWNAEAGRLMQLDFDQAWVVGAGQRYQGESQPATPLALEAEKETRVGKREHVDGEERVDEKRARL